jgi:hypothetical protein
VANIAEVQLMFASRRRLMGLLAGLALVLTLPGAAAADHSWGSYHWARTANPFTLQVGDNVTSAWDGYLNTALSDWNSSVVLNLNRFAASGNARTCKAASGTVLVCNTTYGYNGWLGVAGISVQGGHITKAYVKLNDSYFNSSTYNTPAWRQMVACQEIGHTFGLDHQDENFDNANLGTCMDYTSSPSTNQHPNQGDYDQLRCIYDPSVAGQTLTTSSHSCTGTGHLDSSNSFASGAAAAFPSAAAPAAWGREVARTNGGKTSVFVHDLGAGQLEVTFVIWA